ncbi:MAG: nucleotide sugar dehydrogenase [Sumerlaeia bacterium]
MSTISNIPSDSNLDRARKFVDKDAAVAVIGLGYIGLPLAILFHSAGFDVVGVDTDPAKIVALNAGRSYIQYIPNEPLQRLAQSEKFTPTPDHRQVSRCDAIILCVPTPLTPNREPDLRFITQTAEAIAPHLKRGALVSLESTTYPGTTDDVLIPILEKGSGMKAGVDFLVAYSPEREDPNNPDFSTSRIPKVVGALNEESLAAACALYSAVVERVVPVSSCATAEAAKLVENIFRSVNIAMVNELKLVFERLGIDIWEVIDAAKTKPFGYMPFYPGPGLGGHCIPIDPFYLTWKAREVDLPTKFIELAGEINSTMPYYVVQRTADALNTMSKPLKGSRILLVGIAYKKDVDDVRESPGLKLIELFEEKGALVDFHDPHVPAIPPTRRHAALTGRESVSLDEASGADAVVICTNHSRIDYGKLANDAVLIVDTRNALAGVGKARSKVWKA